MRVETFDNLPPRRHAGTGRKSKYGFDDLKPGQVVKFDDRESYKKAAVRANDWNRNNPDDYRQLINRTYFENGQVAFGIFCIRKEEDE